MSRGIQYENQQLRRIVETFRETIERFGEAMQIALSYVPEGSTDAHRIADLLHTAKTKATEATDCLEQMLDDSGEVPVCPDCKRPVRPQMSAHESR